MVYQPLIGGSFTWNNNQDDPLLCRLDSFLFSVEFDDAFPNALQIVLTRTISDHNLIFVTTGLLVSNKPYFKLKEVGLSIKIL